MTSVANSVINSKDKTQENLPSEVELFPHQVGGHKHGKGRMALGILRHKNGHILKPLCDGDHRSDNELSFYQNVYQNNSTPLLMELKDFLPDFYGTQIVKYPDKVVKYLCLEDVSKSFKKPSILDVKIGSRTYELNATNEKKLEQQSKFLHGAELGIRIVGMKVYNEETDSYTIPEKSYLRSLSASTLPTALSLFASSLGPASPLLQSLLLHRLRRLEEWFSLQRLFSFTASSVLFACEGRSGAWERAFPEHERSSAPDAPPCAVCGLPRALCAGAATRCAALQRVAMIDFAHTEACADEDENYAHGLRNLAAHFRLLLMRE